MKWIGLAVITPLSVINVFAQNIPQNIPSYNDWTFTGCFRDDPVDRSLHHGAGSSDTMTVQTCLDICDSAGFAFGGLEFSRECYCGNALLYGYGLSDACVEACTGNSTQLCGGLNALSVYGNGKLPLTQGPASLVPLYKNYEFFFCWEDGFSDKPHGRTLQHSPTTPIPAEEMSVERCIDGCEASGFDTAGLEFGQECWCDNASFPIGESVGDEECDMPCLMNATEKCGGPDRLLVYTSLFTVPVIFPN